MQAKLVVDGSDDEYEREANRIAEHVTATTGRSDLGLPLPIRRWAGGPAGRVDDAPASVHNALARSGTSLDPALRDTMERRLGYDFSKVRVHADATADRSARELSANAYTVGHDLVFGAGCFAPDTDQGRRLIAHELVHVAQQTGVSGPGRALGAHRHPVSSDTRYVQRNGRKGTGPAHELEQVGAVWHLKLLGFSEAEAVAGLLWPSGRPAGVRIVPLVVVEYPVQVGLFEIAGLTSDALRTMEPGVAKWFALKGLRAPEATPPSASRPPVRFSPGTPPYLRPLDARLRRQLDKEVRFFAEEIAPVKELRRKYPELPLAHDATIEIPALDFQNPHWVLDERPQGRFQLHSQLVGGYELLDYHPPSVIIARDGMGYVINDEIFASKFGQEFPEMFEYFEEPIRWRHEHPGTIVVAEVGVGVALGSLMFLQPELEVGAPFTEGLGAGGGFGVESEGEFAVESEGEFAVESELDLGISDVSVESVTGESTATPEVPAGTAKPAETVGTEPRSGTRAASKTSGEPETTKPASAHGAPSTPRAQRVSELATDPGRGTDKVTIREAKDAVTLEELGPEKGVKGPVRRANPVRYPREEGADFVDADGQLWDHKVAYPKTGEQGQSQIGSVNELVADMEAELARGENIMLNRMLLNETELAYLLRQIAKRGLPLARLRFIPSL